MAASFAGMVELVDTPDLKSVVVRRPGSTPGTRTTPHHTLRCQYVFAILDGRILPSRGET